MAIVNTATNYNGSLNNFLYKVMGLGNDVSDKGAIHMITDIALMQQLDHMVATADPFEDYTDNAPSMSGVVTKDKRDLTPKKFTISGQITESAFLPIWKKYRSIGSLTELQANPQFMQEVFELVHESANTQLAKLIWQGDTAAGGASPLRFFDGLIKLIEADGTVVNVTPAGVITQANIVARLEDMYALIPEKFLNDPNYKIHMSTADYRKLQLFNNDVKKTTVGVLSEIVQDLFLNQKIVHFQSLPENHLIGAHTANTEDSNFCLGMYFDMDSEFSTMRVAKTAPLSKITGYRVDVMAGVQYRYGADILYYKPV